MSDEFTFWKIVVAAIACVLFVGILSVLACEVVRSKTDRACLEAGHEPIDCRSLWERR